MSEFWKKHDRRRAELEADPAALEQQSIDEHGEGVPCDSDWSEFEPSVDSEAAQCG